jgi:hypothetical protein
MDATMTLFVGLLWIGIGPFFMGIGVLWWVSIQAREQAEKRQHPARQP